MTHVAWISPDAHTRCFETTEQQTRRYVGDCIMPSVWLEINGVMCRLKKMNLADWSTDKANNKVEALGKSSRTAKIYTGFNPQHVVRYLFDREQPRLPRQPGKANIYVLSELTGHNTVFTCLPGNQGESVAAVVVNNLACTFPSIKWYIFVGIRGGIPSRKYDIYLCQEYNC